MTAPTIGVERASGTAMSCDVAVVAVDGPQGLAERALGRIEELERLWSRFDDTSDISRINAQPGRPVEVSAVTRRLVIASIEAWHVTHGAFDPTLLGALVRSGYRTSRDDPARRTFLPLDTDARGRPDLVLVDPAASTVQVPTGTALDPGGIGKGLAADLIVEELLGAGAAGALVSIGGDVGVAGRAPDDDAWTIAIEHEHGAVVDHVRLRRGGIATSTTQRRTWTVGELTAHHLIDPATGRPAATTVTAATVVAGSARWAEALTKPAFVGPSDEAVALAATVGAAVLISHADGSRQASPGWGDFSTGTQAGVTP